MSERTIDGRILSMRGEKILLDRDLAELYGVTTGRLNEQVRRNASRFPSDFAFRLTDQELKGLISQFATSKRGGTRKLPMAFTEHGAIMAAAVLNTPRAVQVSVFVVRAFVRLRETFIAQKELTRKLERLENKTAALALRQDELSASTRAQFKHVLEALRQLMGPLREEATKRPIGFVTPKE